MEQPTAEQMDRFVSACIRKGWTVRVITHPKSRAKWPIKRIKRG